MLDPNRARDLGSVLVGAALFGAAFVAALQILSDIRERE
jgi:hypothetical protein